MKRKAESKEESAAKKPNVSGAGAVAGIVRIGTKSGRGVKGPRFPPIPGFTTIDCTSGSMNKIKGTPAKAAFSPLLIGPVKFPKDPEAKIFENFWQYGKVFEQLGHIGKDGKVTEKWARWREAGFKSTKGERHPKGTKTDQVRFVDSQGKRRFEYLRPVFGYYGGERMDYIESRKKVYAPVYASIVKRSPAFLELRAKVLAGENIQIVDLDGPRDGDFFPDPLLPPSSSSSGSSSANPPAATEHGTNSDGDEAGSDEEEEGGGSSKGEGASTSTSTSSGSGGRKALLSHKVTLELLKTKINDPRHPFGHGYVLAGLLAGIDPADYCGTP